MCSLQRGIIERVGFIGFIGRYKACKSTRVEDLQASLGLEG